MWRFIKKDISSACSSVCNQPGNFKNKWFRWLFPISGLLALVWFLARVIPKPSRMQYPCQRVAAPLAGGFVVWIAGAIGSVFAWRTGKELFIRSRLCKAMVCFAVGGVVAIIAIVNMPEEAVLAGATPVNAPIGTGKGVNPGRVVWVHNPDATDWAGADPVSGSEIGSNGYWWQSNHTDQVEVDRMMSKGIRYLTNEVTESAAWDAIFHYFNQNRGKGDVGYVAGEKITIKANFVASHPSWGNVDGDCNQIANLGWVDTSPQMIVSLLDQLVNVVGVAQSDITVGDTTSYFPNHYWDICHSVFPNVHYLAAGGGWGRQAPVTPSSVAMYWSSPTGTAGKTQDYLPVSYADAAYLINFPCLKWHPAGITLCGKNHYGSFNRSPSQAGFYSIHTHLPSYPAGNGTGIYREHVDIMGHSQLGGKTLLYLVDGLYGGYRAQGRGSHKWTMAPFNTDWPSSLFVSQDPVAIDSVCYNFLLEEDATFATGGDGAAGALLGSEEDYMHEGALANSPPSGTNYHPDHPDTGGTGPYLSASLGVHEHWNNPTDKQYTRNLGTNFGIELIATTVTYEKIPGDLNNNQSVDGPDVALFGQQWLRREIIIEAEDYQTKTFGSGAGAGRWWDDKVGLGSKGSGYMESLVNLGVNITTSIESTSPRLSYNVDFSSAGTYYVWVKGSGVDGSADSYHYGLDGSCRTTTGASLGGILTVFTEFVWRSDDANGSRPTIVVASSGVHSLDIWMREDGSKIDQILLTTDASFDPDQMADVNYDGSADIEDFGVFSGNWLKNW